MIGLRIVPLLLLVGSSAALPVASQSITQPRVRNLGVAALRHYCCPQPADGLVAWHVAEIEQGGVDLNGDGDIGDKVLHVFDARTGRLTNLALVSTAGQASDGFVAFLVQERWQGNTDLNDDGDTRDYVLHVYNSTDGTVTNLGTAATGYRVSGRFVAFEVREADQGELDLNGDGDTSDSVPHLYDMVAGRLTNLAMACSSWLVFDSYLVLKVNENSQGSTDLNRDGDALDWVVHVYELRTARIRNTGLAAGYGRVSISGDKIAIGGSEFSQGNSDFNGDGDTEDSVVFVADIGRGGISGARALSTELANHGSFESPSFIGKRWLSIVVKERDQGWIDLNGDGDTHDRVLHSYDLASGAKRNLELALKGSGTEPLTNLEIAAFRVIEGGQDYTDFNGDGDALDPVLHIYDPRTPGPENMGLAVASGWRLDGHLLVFRVVEDWQGGLDLNGDGDSRDTILHVYDTQTGITDNLGITASSWIVVNNNRIAFLVNERAEGPMDLNGDGDTSDYVLHVHEWKSRRTTNLGLAAKSLGNGRPRIGPRILSMLVSEEAQGGQDLNNDGDSEDYVWHVVTWPSISPGLHQDN